MSLKSTGKLKESSIDKNNLLLYKQDYETKTKQFKKYRWAIGFLALLQKHLLKKAKEKFDKENSKSDFFIGNGEGVFSSDKKKFKILDTYSLGTDAFLQPVLVNNINQHISLFGGSGSGKSVWLFSFLNQTLQKGGGFVFMDGKGDLSMYTEMIRLTADHKRLDDFLVLNFNDNSKLKGKKISNSFNIFETMELKDIKNIISSITVGKADDFFAKQTSQTLDNIFHILSYLKSKGDLVNFSIFLEAIDLKALIVNLIPADKNDPLQPDPDILRYNGLEQYKRFWIKKDYMVDGLIAANEISSLIGTYSAQLWYDEDTARENGFKFIPDEQLVTQIGGYAGMTLSALKTTVMPFANIFNTPKNDIDFEKAIAQNKIIYIIMPAMKMSAKTPHAIGSFVLESLKTAAGDALGSDTEVGSTRRFDRFDKIRRTASPTYPIVLDELASFFEMSLNSLGLFLAQARSIKIAVVLSTQDIASLAGVEGGQAFVDKLIGNTYTSVFLKTKDKQTLPYAQNIYAEKDFFINENGERETGESMDEIINYLKECKLGLGIMLNEKFGKFCTPYVEPKTDINNIKFRPTS